MGCSASSLAVVDLNRSLKTSDGTHVLQDKLQTSPWLLSAATPVFASTAGTPFHIACERKQVEVVQQMLAFLTCASLPVVHKALQPYCRRHGLVLPASTAEGVRIAVEMVNCKGQTPLMCACAAGSPELVKLLLAQGADPWAGDRCGCRTPLHYAALSGSAPCIEALMQNLSVRHMAREGVRYVNVRSLCGITPLHYAVYFNHTAAVEELLRHDPLICVASNSQSYDIMSACATLSTPLHFAAARGNVAIVRQLLQHHVLHPTSGRDPRLRADHDHQLPWQVAAAQHTAHRELVLLLHPGRSLEDALGLSAVAGAGAGRASLTRTGPASLAVLAATALQTALLADLERVQGQVAAGGGSRAGEGLDGAGSALGGAAAAVTLRDRHGLTAGRMAVGEPPCPDPLSAVQQQQQLSQPSPRSAPSCGGAATATSAAGIGSCSRAAEGVEAALCGVCFAEREVVAPAGCGHGICGGCAAQMCRLALGGVRPRPLLCAFCRREVAGFVAVVSRQEACSC